MVIGWVLLVGFAVTIGILVYNWSTDYAEQSVISVVNFVSGKTECTDVSINVILCIGGFSQAEKVGMNITNKGLFNIYGVSVNVFTDGNAHHAEFYGEREGKINVKNSRTIVTDISVTSIEFIEVTPVLEINQELIGCSDRKVILTEEILNSEEWLNCANQSPSPPGSGPS